MALSDDELKILAGLEEQLSSDHKFVSTMRKDDNVSFLGTSRNIVLGILVVVIGVAIILASVTTNILILGVLGFAVMLAGGFLGTQGNQRGKSGSNNGSSELSPLFKRLEDKWDKRAREEEEYRNRHQ